MKIIIEFILQRVINDFNRELNEKADIEQLDALRDDINNHMQNLYTKLRTLSDIVGEPRSAAVTRRLYRDTACISCSTPACMDIEEKNIPKLPALPRRPPTVGAEAPKDFPNEDGDHICYVGATIPHDVSPRFGLFYKLFLTS